MGELLEDDNRDVMAALVQNIDIIIKAYVNQHAINQHQAALDDVKSPSASLRVPVTFGGFKHSNSAGSGKNFVDSNPLKKPKKADAKPLKQEEKPQRKNSNDEKEEQTSAFSTYLIMPEYATEQLYSELLIKLFCFNQNLHSVIGLWREHALFLEKFTATFHLFHMPEIQD